MPQATAVIMPGKNGIRFVSKGDHWRLIWENELSRICNDNKYPVIQTHFFMA